MFYHFILFFNCYMHCFSMLFNVVIYSALVSVSVLRHLRSCHIIIIIFSLVKTRVGKIKKSRKRFEVEN